MASFDAALSELSLNRSQNREKSNSPNLGLLHFTVGQGLLVKELSKWAILIH